jgi:hypothetical protein
LKFYYSLSCDFSFFLKNVTIEYSLIHARDFLKKVTMSAAVRRFLV